MSSVVKDLYSMSIYKQIVSLYANYIETKSFKFTTSQFGVTICACSDKGNLYQACEILVTLSDQKRAWVLMKTML